MIASICFAVERLICISLSGFIAWVSLSQCRRFSSFKSNAPPANVVREKKCARLGPPFRVFISPGSMEWQAAHAPCHLFVPSLFGRGLRLVGWFLLVGHPGVEISL